MLDKEKLSISIGEIAQEHILDMKNHIDNYFSNYCVLSPDSKKAIMYASEEAYFAALKTIEAAIISSLDD